MLSSVTWSLLVVAISFTLVSTTRVKNRLEVKSNRATPSQHYAYQEDLIRKTAPFRPGPHTYAGYAGPWLENVFFTEWVRQPPVLHRIYLPVAWTDCLHNKSHLREAVQAFLDNLDPAFQYFSVAQLDMAFQHPMLTLHIPENVDFWLFSAGGSSGSLRTTPVPLLKQELVPRGVAKSIDASFQGSMTHPLRQALHDKFHKVYHFFSNNDNWKQIIESSNFSFCPRGYGTTSFRLFETLQLGTVPIYIWEDEAWLPYNDIIDWNTFALIVESNELAGLPRRIEMANVTQMLDVLSHVKHMFTYNYTIQYIIKEVRNEEVDQEGGGKEVNLDLHYPVHNIINNDGHPDKTSTT